MRKIIIILDSVLEALGLQHLLSHIQNLSVHHQTTDYQISSQALFNSTYIITTPQYFISNLELMLPIRQKVVLLIGQGQNLNKMSQNNGPICISTSQSEETIKAIFDKLFKQESVPEQNTGEKLSSRELEVLRLIAQGLINKEISDQLNISINTVQSHRKNISAKLGIKSTSGLSFYALMNGLISPK